MGQGPLMSQIDDILEPFDFNADATLFGSSLCPDEINHEVHDLPNLLTKRFGEQFSLGGLGGMPFTGTAGFGAFAAHVPKGGKIFVIFGPHVAISPTGEVGKYKRLGQDTTSTACGACIGALAAVEKEIADGTVGAATDTKDQNDMQIQFLIDQIRAKHGDICKHKMGTCPSYLFGC